MLRYAQTNDERGSLMNLYHLRYFVTLAHLEHYTKAAEILSITQPSLSHAISSLEKELGVKLFEKDGRNVVLTKCGQAFLDDVEHSLCILDSCINKLQMTGSGEGHIDIAMLPSLSTIVSRHAKDFLDSQPDKGIDFYFHTSTGLTSDILHGLKKRRYDIAFCTLQENEPLIDFVPISKQKLVLIVPKGHPLENRDSVDLAETLPYPQIMFSKESGLETVIDKLFEDCGGRPKVAYSIGDDQIVADLVSAGFGIAIIPHMPTLNNMPVKIIEITNSTWERIFYMATLKNVYQAPIVHEFKQFIEKKNGGL